MSSRRLIGLHCSPWSIRARWVLDHHRIEYVWEEYTPMLGEFEKYGALEGIRSRIPNGRVADADDVAKLALYLASDDSAYSTGAEFVVDGGMTAGL